MSYKLGHKHPFVSNSIGNQYYSCLTTQSCDKPSINKFKLYRGKYALCTAASCEQDPNDPNILNCNCEVNNGLAIGLNSRINFGDTEPDQVYSLYSGINLPVQNLQTCNNGVWGDCLNKICTINPNDNTKAICMCKKISKTPWITFQFKNDPNPCSCNNLSGAYYNDFSDINNFYNLYNK